jgi:hypothetical protein
MQRVRYRRHDEGEDAVLEEAPFGYGALLNERSLFNIGFFIGIGFACANLLLGLLMVAFAVLIFEWKP